MKLQGDITVTLHSRHSHFTADITAPLQSSRNQPSFKFLIELLFREYLRISTETWNEVKDKTNNCIGDSTVTGKQL
jgi:hypothetical protein